MVCFCIVFKPANTRVAITDDDCKVLQVWLKRCIYLNDIDVIHQDNSLYAIIDAYSYNTNEVLTILGGGNYVPYHIVPIKKKSYLHSTTYH